MMTKRCDELEPLIEAIADGSHPLAAEEAAHVESCAVCGARIERARTIDSLLQMRDVPVPPASFGVTVMQRVGQERWKAERAIDLGFNLAMAAGVAVILSGAAGLAWSLGFLSIAIDLGALWDFIDADTTGRVLSQMQTIGMSAVLLTMALALWWWAEAAAE